MEENGSKWSFTENNGTQEAIKQYLQSVFQNLQCVDERKKEIIKELESDIRIALEQGEFWDEVQARMGTPEEIAEEFNENFPEDYKAKMPGYVDNTEETADEFAKTEYLHTKKKKVFALAGMVVLLAVLTIIGGSFIYGDGDDSRARDSKPDESLVQEDTLKKEDVSKQQEELAADELEGHTEAGGLPGDIKEHSDYDEEDVIEQTKKIISLVDAGDYETLRKEYTAEIMLGMMEQSQMDEAKKTICADWGSFLSYGNFYTRGVEQAGEKFVVIQVNVSYENANVTFAITLDEEMKLVGIYMM